MKGFKNFPNSFLVAVTYQLTCSNDWGKYINTAEVLKNKQFEQEK